MWISRGKQIQNCSASFFFGNSGPPPTSDGKKSDTPSLRRTQEILQGFSVTKWPRGELHGAVFRNNTNRPIDANHPHFQNAKDFNQKRNYYWSCSACLLSLSLALSQKDLEFAPSSNLKKRNYNLWVQLENVLYDSMYSLYRRPKSSSWDHSSTWIFDLKVSLFQNWVRY